MLLVRYINQKKMKQLLVSEVLNYIGEDVSFLNILSQYRKTKGIVYKELSDMGSKYFRQVTRNKRMLYYSKTGIVSPRLGSRWLCIKDVDISHNVIYRKGKIYRSETDGRITDGIGEEYYWTGINSDKIIFNLFNYFELIPRNKRYNGKYYYKYKEG